MGDKTRRVYKGIALALLMVGTAFLSVALLERLLDFAFFNASPVRVALLTLIIGGLLWWTIRSRPE
ncbi:MAG: hypothetical protein OXC09_07570 [Truepera sp.]|nr:hypothetical protein [Truepera sp.]